MDDVELHSAILGVLARWSRLPETDLLRRLTPLQAVRYGVEHLQQLVQAGLLEVREVGDERVLILTERGREAAGPGQTL